MEGTPTNLLRFLGPFRAVGFAVSTRPLGEVTPRVFLGSGTPQIDHGEKKGRAALPLRSGGPRTHRSLLSLAMSTTALDTYAAMGHNLCRSHGAEHPCTTYVPSRPVFRRRGSSGKPRKPCAWTRTTERLRGACGGVARRRGFRPAILQARFLFFLPGLLKRS